MRHRIRLIAGSLVILAPGALVGQVGAPAGSGNSVQAIHGTAHVTGMVRDANGRALGHVRVTVIGLGRETRTSLRGLFQLDSLPAAMFTLEAVRIGALPGRVVIDLQPGDTVSANISLGQGIPVLETREITAKWATEIERRARVSTSGYFVKSAEIAARGRNAPLPSLLYQVPSVRVVCGTTSSSCRVLMRSGVTSALGARYCTPSLYIDGIRDRLGGFTRLYSGEILAIEVYRSLGRPFEFLDDNACGAVAVWTHPSEAGKR